MATHQLSLRSGVGSFLVQGEELSYDSTPAIPGIGAVGGAIDFSSRPSQERGMLRGNSNAGESAQADRSQAVIYGGFTP